MSKIQFTPNDYPTVGVEIELQLVDAGTLALRSAIEEILSRCSESLCERVKPELMQCYLEINTDVCRTAADVRKDLAWKTAEVEKVTGELGLKLFWAGTHPFSTWREQEITVNERYQRLVELMQDVARQLVTFGLHVHVGVDSGDKAVMICDRMMSHLPLLLALSSNSPFWESRRTGLCSNRSMVMEGLPTAGLPHPMRNWSEYVWLINHLVGTGFINTIREIWWDIRPHHNFGTVEIRVCDMPPSLDHVVALTALIQCMVQTISEEIDEGTYQYDYHPMMIQQNKWRAIRFGSDAQLVSSDDYKLYTVEQRTERLVKLLRPIARRLHCADELESVLDIPANTGAKQQLAIYEETGSLREVVRTMIERHEGH